MNSDWELKRIDEVATAVSGGTPSRDIDEFWDGEINWATPTDITRGNNRILKFTKEKITLKGVQNSSTKILPIGTLLMTSRATLVAIKIAGTEVCTNQGFKSLIPKDSIDKWFLFYQMKNHKTQYERYGIGTTFLEVNKSDTDRFLLPFPKEKSTQTKIAQILTTLDNVIEKTEATIEKYEAIKKGMMHDLFTRGIGSDGQVRPRYEEAPELYKKSALGWIPKEWRIEPISNVTSYVDYRGKTPPKSDSGIYLVTAKNVKFGYIDYNCSREYILPSSYESTMSRGKPLVGDVLITTEAPMGNVAQVNREGIALAQRIIKYRAADSELTNDFLKNTFLSDYFQNLLYSQSTGSTVTGIKGSKLHKLEIFIPMKNEQILINKRLNEIESLLNSEKEFLSKQTQLKQGLMQDLLTGKVSVNTSSKITV